MGGGQQEIAVTLLRAASQVRNNLFDVRCILNASSGFESRGILAAPAAPPDV